MAGRYWGFVQAGKVRDSRLALLCAISQHLVLRYTVQLQNATGDAMNTSTAQNKASWSGPSLAIAVAAACALMAGSTAYSVATPKAKTATVAKGISSNMEALVERAVSELKTLETGMSKYTKILCQDHVPEKYLHDQPFGLIADNLRFAEGRFRELGSPKGGEAEYDKLVRALAKARSVAAMNDSLIRQRTIVPEIFESDIDLDGLKALAAHTTQRLVDQVS